ASGHAAGTARHWHAAVAQPAGAEEGRQREQGEDGGGEMVRLHRCAQYREPALTTGWVLRSPHSTTSRLLTIAARRSSSRRTVPFFSSSASAISTMPTAPATIRVRAAITEIGRAHV